VGMIKGPVILLVVLVAGAVAVIAATMAGFRRERSLSICAAGFICGSAGMLLTLNHGLLGPWFSDGLSAVLQGSFGICLAWGIRTWMRMLRPWPVRFSLYVCLLALAQAIFLPSFVLRNSAECLVALVAGVEFLLAMERGKRELAFFIKRAVRVVGVAYLLGILLRFFLLVSNGNPSTESGDYGTYGIFSSYLLAVFFVLWGGVVIAIEFSGVVAELDEKNRILRNLATTDDLTGLGNRRMLESRIPLETERASRYREHLSLVLFDLDHFKLVNDIWGHEMGDKVLARIAEKASALIRAADSIFRWGGEEFIILAPYTDLEGAKALAEKLRAALAGEIHGKAGHVTASFGVTEWRPGELEPEWFKRVDRALYLAKNSGRNRVTGLALEDLLPSAPVSLDWIGGFQSGISLIDDQHRQLVELANQSLDLSTAPFTTEEVHDYLDRLFKLIEQHFADEERALADSGYPHLIDHIQCHRNLVREAHVIERRFLEGVIGPEGVFDFLGVRRG